MGIVTLLMLFHFLGWLRSVENWFRNLLTPFFSGTHSFSIKVGDSYEFFSNRQSVISAYQACRDTSAKNQVDMATIAVLTEENQELKKILAFKENSSRQLVVANVVGNDLNDVEKTIILNRGQADGLKLNQPVIAESGVLIGKLIAVEDQQAMARLLPDNRSKIIAALLNQERSTGVVEGGYGLSLRLKFIPRNEIVTVGQQVITSGLENGIPRGLLIGTVAVVENEAYQPFQQALITPIVDYSKLTVVSVITNQ